MFGFVLVSACGFFAFWLIAMHSAKIEFTKQRLAVTAVFSLALASTPHYLPAIGAIPLAVFVLSLAYYKMSVSNAIITTVASLFVTAFFGLSLMAAVMALGSP